MKSIYICAQLPYFDRDPSLYDSHFFENSLQNVKESELRYPEFNMAQRVQLNKGVKWGIFEIEIADNTNIKSNFPITPGMIKSLTLHCMLYSGPKIIPDFTTNQQTTYKP